MGIREDAIEAYQKHEKFLAEVEQNRQKGDYRLKIIFLEKWMKNNKLLEKYNITWGSDFIYGKITPVATIGDVDFLVGENILGSARYGVTARFQHEGSEKTIFLNSLVDLGQFFHDNPAS